jgi:hypothetical protein
MVRIHERIGAGLDRPKDRDRAAVTTWRYLRLGLVLMAVGLAAAVLYERLKVGTCWQGSISAYYYTPVQGFLVGALVTIGVCLFCIRGASDGEDVLLNLAGMCAPFVALVPTPHTGSCGSILEDTANRNLNIGNNVTALLVVAALTLAVTGAIGFTGTREEPPRRPSRMDVVGFGIAAGGLAIATGIFLWDRTRFTDNAHNAAAVLLFVFIFLNVCLNAVQRFLVRRRAGEHPGWFNRYAVLAAAMLAVTAVHVVLWARDWPYWVLTIEASLITLFAVFWSLQTGERWADGVSPEPAPQRRAPTPPEAAGRPETVGQA